MPDFTYLVTVTAQTQEQAGTWELIDAEPQPDGFVGGDGACESVSIRFRHTVEPAQITVFLYVVDLDERSGDDNDYPFDYEEMVEYSVFESIEDMDEGEPIWTDYTYDNPSIRSWEYESDAEDYRDAEASRWILKGASDYISWDGKPVY